MVFIYAHSDVYQIARSAQLAELPAVGSVFTIDGARFRVRKLIDVVITHPGPGQSHEAITHRIEVEPAACAVCGAALEESPSPGHDFGTALCDGGCDNRPARDAAEVIFGRPARPPTAAALERMVRALVRDL